MEQLYSLQSAAELLDVSVRTVRRLIKRHDIRVKRVGRRIRLTQSQVELMIQDEESIDDFVEQML